jgi:hypothetical protein
MRSRMRERMRLRKRSVCGSVLRSACGSSIRSVCYLYATYKLTCSTCVAAYVPHPAAYVPHPTDTLRIGLGASYRYATYRILPIRYSSIRAASYRYATYTPRMRYASVCTAECMRSSATYASVCTVYAAHAVHTQAYVPQSVCGRQLPVYEA